MFDFRLPTFSLERTLAEKSLSDVLINRRQGEINQRKVVASLLEGKEVSSEELKKSVRRMNLTEVAKGLGWR